ncbi:nose resistant to fluoxetine protein 6-like, partial [Tropilaelaps mercedesae]
ADASGKPPAGLVEGTLSFLGSYDECLSTVAWRNFGGTGSSRNRRDADSDPLVEDSSEWLEAGDPELAFVGSYCTLQVAPNFDFIELFHNLSHAVDRLGAYLGSEKIAKKTLRIPGSHVGYRIGICVPSACTKDDIDKGRYKISRKESVVPCHAASQLNLRPASRCRLVTKQTLTKTREEPVLQLLQHLLRDVDFQGTVTRCETRKEVPVSNLQMAIMGVALILLALVVLGTLMEACCSAENVPQNPKEAALNGTEIDSALVRLVRCFSLQGNCSELLGLNNVRSSNLAVLDGVRSISMLWVIFGHTYFFVENVQPFRM